MAGVGFEPKPRSSTLMSRLAATDFPFPAFAAAGDFFVGSGTGFVGVGSALGLDSLRPPCVGESSVEMAGSRMGWALGSALGSTLGAAAALTADCEGNATAAATLAGGAFLTGVVTYLEARLRRF